MKRWFLFGLVNVLIMAVLSAILYLTGLDQYITQQYGAGYMSMMVFCLFWGMGGSIISLLMSKWMAKTMHGVQIVDTKGPYAEIVQMVHHQARKAGFSKMPEVGVYDSPDINAFATGPSKNNSLVAVSTGLLRGMNRDEIEGVLAHEVAHIANGDMVTMTLIQGVLNAFVMFFARVIAGIINNAMKDENGRGGLGSFAYFGVTMVLQMVFGVLASFVTAWFSRYREYRADLGGAKLAGKEKMVAALRRLQSNYESLKPADNNMASFQISSKSKMFELLSTHPPLAQRIKALERITSFN
jgi:heat shock protein HtpX